MVAHLRYELKRAYMGLLLLLLVGPFMAVADATIPLKQDVLMLDNAICIGLDLGEFDLQG